MEENVKDLIFCLGFFIASIIVGVWSCWMPKDNEKKKDFEIERLEKRLHEHHEHHKS